VQIAVVALNLQILTMPWKIYYEHLNTAVAFDAGCSNVGLIELTKSAVVEI